MPAAEFAKAPACFTEQQAEANPAQNVSHKSAIKFWVHFRIWPMFAIFSGNVNRSSHIATYLGYPMITVSLHATSHTYHPPADRNSDSMAKMNLTRAIP